MYESRFTLPGPIRDVYQTIPLPILQTTSSEICHHVRAASLTFDASRKGTCSVTPSRSSMNTFRPVHVRMSPGFRRKAFSTLWKVEGKKQLCKIDLRWREIEPRASV